MAEYRIPFHKMHGIGNDFILVAPASFPQNTDFHALAPQLCHRHFGIGADGLILRFDSETSDHRMQIINADGSEAEMCGNGLRCFVKYIHDYLRDSRLCLNIETLAGVMHTEFDPINNQVQVDMGAPILEAAQIPAQGFEQSPVLNVPIHAAGQTWNATLVSMGNPHCVIFVDDLKQVSLAQWGPMIETLPIFPKKTNVEFVQVENPQQARVKVWERGAGPTLACGTGACAVLVAGVLTGCLQEKADIILPGGPLHIYWNRAIDRVYMTGPASHVFEGSFIYMKGEDSH